ncbi:MAG: hypothetical protein OXD41_06075 [Thaumarchaeota archaeon]|nr:hypothetical protein [Nitrososphaerota archaeon]
MPGGAQKAARAFPRRSERRDYAEPGGPYLTSGAEPVPPPPCQSTRPAPASSVAAARGAGGRCAADEHLRIAYEGRIRKRGHYKAFVAVALSPGDHAAQAELHGSRDG